MFSSVLTISAAVLAHTVAASHQFHHRVKVAVNRLKTVPDAAEAPDGVVIFSLGEFLCLSLGLAFLHRWVNLYCVGPYGVHNLLCV